MSFNLVVRNLYDYVQYIVGNDCIEFVQSSKQIKLFNILGNKVKSD